VALPLAGGEDGREGSAKGGRAMSGLPPANWALEVLAAVRQYINIKMYVYVHLYVCVYTSISISISILINKYCWLPTSDWALEILAAVRQCVDVMNI